MSKDRARKGKNKKKTQPGKGKIKFKSSRKKKKHGKKYHEGGEELDVQGGGEPERKGA